MFAEHLAKVWVPETEGNVGDMESLWGLLLVLRHSAAGHHSALVHQLLGSVWVSEPGAAVCHLPLVARGHKHPPAHLSPGLGDHGQAGNGRGHQPPSLLQACLV